MYDVVNMPDLVRRYFSSDLWLCAFIISIIYLFFRLNTAGKRAMLVAIVALLLIINSSVIKLFTFFDENSTFYRHLWAIPSIAIIGVAVIDLIRILPRWYLKIVAIMATVLFLWFANQEYIRCRDQIVSIDAKMVPEDVVELGDNLEQIRSETGKNTLFLVCPISYERSYGNFSTELNLYTGFLNITDSSLLSDGDHNGEAELTEGNPDVEYIMSNCCKNGMDYVVVARTGETEEIFNKQGYEPKARLKSFLLYECKGYKGYEQDLNNWGQVIYKTYYDESGNPSMIPDGYCTVTYGYEGGLKVSEKYFDTQGKPCVMNLGYSYIEYDHNNKGMITGVIYYNEQGKRSLINNLYSEIRKTYRSDNRIESITYYGISGEPCSILGRIKTIYSYDSIGRMIKEEYQDRDNNLIDRDDNTYSTRIIEYNENYQIISEAYYNSEGEPVKALAGYHKYVKMYGMDKTIEGVVFFDEFGKEIDEQQADIRKEFHNLYYMDRSDGARENNNRGINFTTLEPGNQFTFISFQVRDINTGEYLADFSTEKEIGMYNQQYEHQLPDGLYYLLTKANGTIKDEYLRGIVYLENGSSYNISYGLVKFNHNDIEISELSVHKSQ